MVYMYVCIVVVYVLLCSVLYLLCVYSSSVCVCMYSVQQQQQCMYTCMYVYAQHIMYVCMCVYYLSLSLSLCVCVVSLCVYYDHCVYVCVYYVLLYSSSVCTTTLCVHVYYYYCMYVCMCTTTLSVYVESVCMQYIVCVCMCVDTSLCVCVQYVCVCITYSVCVCMYVLLLCACVASPHSLRACVLPGACGLGQGCVPGCVYASIVSMHSVSDTRVYSSVDNSCYIVYRCVAGQRLDRWRVRQQMLSSGKWSCVYSILCWGSSCQQASLPQAQCVYVQVC